MLTSDLTQGEWEAVSVARYVGLGAGLDGLDGDELLEAQDHEQSVAGGWEL